LGGSRVQIQPIKIELGSVASVVRNQDAGTTFRRHIGDERLDIATEVIGSRFRSRLRDIQRDDYVIFPTVAVGVIEQVPAVGRPYEPPHIIRRAKDVGSLAIQVAHPQGRFEELAFQPGNVLAVGRQPVPPPRRRVGIECPQWNQLREATVL